MTFRSLLALLIIISSLKVFSQEKPNILIFIADDAGMDMGAYGNPVIQTPNLDQLAQEGVLFENAFLTTSQCSPSRSSILSGQFAHTIGTEDLHTPVKPHTMLLPSYLKSEGYFSGMIMKSHLGELGTAQFDHYQYGDDKDALELFKEFVEKKPNETPFFAWVAFHDPHRPYANNNDVEKKHDPNEVIVPPYFDDTPATRQDIAYYYDELSRLDENVGKILNYLEKEGLKENTVVIYLSDNGMPFPRGKATLYDFGIQTPLIFYWESGDFQSARLEALSSVIDIAPTIMELAGAPKPKVMYGESLLPLLTGKTKAGRKYVFAERNWHDTDEHARAIRTASHKVIVNGYPERSFPLTADYYGPVWFDLMNLSDNGHLNKYQKSMFQVPRNRVELYDLRKDPYEIFNLVGKPGNRDLLNELTNELREWGEETNDYSPLIKRKEDIVDRLSGYHLIRKKSLEEFYQMGYIDTLNQQKEGFE
jgi:arylsulfatase A-like enzyme